MPLLAASWALYLWYRVDPHALTMAGFESAFPLLAWQLLFVHGIAIGYHRNDVSAFVARMPAITPRVAVLVTAGFTMFAFCNPWTDGPSWLHLRVVSPDRFASLYARYFTLSDLGVGRLLNLSIALPVGVRDADALLGAGAPARSACSSCSGSARSARLSFTSTACCCWRTCGSRTASGSTRWRR